MIARLMTDVLELLSDVESVNQRKEVAEYINSHPDEFVSLFESDKLESHRDVILDLVDLLSTKLAVIFIERVIGDSNSRIRVRGLQAAYRMRIDSLNSQLVDILASTEEEFEVRKWIVHILGSTDPASYGRVLRRIARDEREDVNLRKEAVFALTRVRSDETLGTLCALLGDSSTEMRESGAWALSNISAPESFNCLLAALEDESEKVRDWAIRGLRDMDDSRALQGLADTIMKVPPNEQVRMIRLIVERRSEIILRAITQLLGSEDVEVLRVASWAVGVSPYPPAVPALRDLIDHADEQVRYYSKVALVRCGGIDPTELHL